MQNQRVGTVFWLLIVAVVCVVGYLAIGSGVYFWKEHVHHYASWARSELLALHAMQENYRADHGRYASNFSELPIPLGAQVQDDVLLWNGPYRMRFTRLLRDQNGNVVRYTIQAAAQDFQLMRLMRPAS